MLIQFRFRNYKCFRDEQTLSMIANSDNSHPENVVSTTSAFKSNILKTVAIYGANASGKSKILEAFKIL